MKLLCPRQPCQSFLHHGRDQIARATQTRPRHRENDPALTSPTHPPKIFAKIQSVDGVNPKKPKTLNLNHLRQHLNLTKIPRNNPLPVRAYLDPDLTPCPTKAHYVESFKACSISTPRIGIHKPTSSPLFRKGTHISPLNVAHGTGQSHRQLPAKVCENWKPLK